VKALLHFIQRMLLCAGPVLFALACADAFKPFEPTREYTNVGGFYLLGLGWVGQWKAIWRLVARRPGLAWGGAAVFCVTMLVSGEIFFVFWPRDWAAWWVIIPTAVATGFVLLSDDEADDSKPKADDAAGTAFKPGPAVKVEQPRARDAQGAKISGVPVEPRLEPPMADEPPQLARAPRRSPSAAPVAPPKPRRWLALAGAALLLLFIFGGMATFLFSGPGGARMREEARAYFGSAEAQLALGWRYREGDMKRQDYEQAAKWFARAAKNGSARAHFDLGVLHYYGLIGRADGAVARAELDAAAAQDYVPALNLRGLIAQNDDGDTVLAIEFWTRSAGLRDAWGEHLLGSALLQQRAAGEDKLIGALVHLERARRQGVEPIKGMIEHVWATVDEEAFDRVADAVYREVEGEGTG
jgi:hypothetical protein